MVEYGIVVWSSHTKLSAIVMDTKGISIALKLVIFITVLSIFSVLMNVIKGPEGTGQATTPTPSITVTLTPTPTVSVISNGADVDSVSEEVDSAVAEIDSLDSELLFLDASFSTVEIDAQVKELDKLK